MRLLGRPVYPTWYEWVMFVTGLLVWIGIIFFLFLCAAKGCQGFIR